MKTTTLTIIALMGLCAGLQAENLSTVDGTTYHNITTQRVDPDGLYIEYTPPGGGLGMAKVKFSRLTADQQKQFGYDPVKAREFEAQCAKATEDFRQQALRWDEAAKAGRSEQQARELEMGRYQNERILALAQLNEAEADLARAGDNSGSIYGGDGYGGGYWGGGYSLYAVPPLNGSLHSRNGGLEIVPNKIRAQNRAAGQSSIFNTRNYHAPISPPASHTIGIR